MKHILAGLVVCALMSGCASSTIDVWADRGIEGVGYGQQNIGEFVLKIRDKLDQRQATDVDMVFDDILKVGTGQVPDVAIDEQWVTEHKRGLLLLLKLHKAENVELDEAKEKALGNLAHITQAFVQIKRLRRSWGKLDELTAQVDRLTVLVGQLIQRDSK